MILLNKHELNRPAHTKMLISMFIGMIVISLAIPLIMIDSPCDYRISSNQIYAALFMSAAMILISGHTYDPHILASMALLCIFNVLAIRHQLFIDYKQYLRDMIPHHSMAVLTSKKQAGTTSPTQQLATTILDTQVKEIILMKSML